jgi:hypothetical protein
MLLTKEPFLPATFDSFKMFRYSRFFADVFAPILSFFTSGLLEGNSYLQPLTIRIL